MPSEIDLTFIRRRLDQLGEEVAHLRADVAIIMAPLARVEVSITAPVIGKLERTDGE